MIDLRDTLKSAGAHILIYLKWTAMALATGGLCGLCGAAFDHTIQYVTHLRANMDWIYFLIPVGCEAVILLYRLLHVKTSTGMNDVIDTVRDNDELPRGIGPAIFTGTVLSQFVGASTGREGAALQLGAAVAAEMGRLFRLKHEQLRPLLLCGMSAVFAAMFGTPVTAALFIIEFTAVGEMRYARLLPSIIGSVTAYWVSQQLGVEPVRYALRSVPALEILPALQVAALGMAAAAISIVFCVCVHEAHEYCRRTLHNDFLRALLISLLLLGLTLLVQNHDYNGAGMNLITDAIAGKSRPETFALKLLFTTLSIAAGFKGGEIVPAFAVGASMGCVLSTLIGLSPSFGAAIGMIAMFCGVMNCPVAAIVLSVEVFGAEALPYFAIACAISYMLSGYYGLYGKQKIIYAKPGAEFGA